MLALEIFGIRLIGLNAGNGRKLLASLIALLILWGVTKLIQWTLSATLSAHSRAAFWARQFLSVAAAVLTVVALVSIWFDNPERATTALGLFTAGLAFALQRVVTALAGYVLILRGNTFNVGDRIKMGGVRGDVIRIGFLQTTIMEMGQPPAEQQETPGMWVESRQYSGRIVSISNAQIFEEPVYNYTRDFPFLFEEMHLPVSFKDDRQRAEEILLDAARRYAVPDARIPEAAMREMQRRYFMEHADVSPRVYWRITDNWLELTVRFVAETHGVREVKDRMSRDILQAFDAAGIGIASATYEIVGIPTLKLEDNRPSR